MWWMGLVQINILLLISRQSNDSLETEDFLSFICTSLLSPLSSVRRPTSGSLHKNKTFIKSSPSVLQSLQTIQTCHLLQSSLLSLRHTSNSILILKLVCRQAHSSCAHFNMVSCSNVNADRYPCCTSHPLPTKSEEWLKKKITARFKAWNLSNFVHAILTIMQWNCAVFPVSQCLQNPAYEGYILCVCFTDFFFCFENGSHDCVHVTRCAPSDKCTLTHPPTLQFPSAFVASFSSLFWMLFLFRFPKHYWRQTKLATSWWKYWCTFI